MDDRQRFRGIGPGSPSPGVRASLVSVGARKWYFGALIGLSWTVNIAVDVVPHLDRAEVGVFLATVIAFAVLFAVIPPINWALPSRIRLLLPTGLLAFSFVFWPLMGPHLYSFWVYVGVCAAMSLVGFGAMLGYVAAVTALTIGFGWLAGLAGDALFYYPATTASVSLMMAAFARVLGSMNQLRATQAEMARLAVEQERTRVARDMHDILGHSLTVITVKAELAGRLVESDPRGAAREIAEVEALARGALADVRTTVAGYRGVSIASELANARQALEAAGIEPDLPGTVDAVPAERRELFGWVVREGVTNVVRHSRARHCTVQLGPDFVEVVDDGRGASGQRTGTGLAGLDERATAAGARMTAGALPDGGYRLRVST
ncbi:sensor histidine kinase [Galbitalea sp. SE-J8]|uniref:sensor histidine kinase n=1 Tax=Galbitalea sp. SE-J8 TaxID=3054952 RepID=UPI00259CE501|nr:sensor histidine kinase [Galbitalea sp. SE-J8]MDM4762620.1 sensor histidine kinase [Galbitalea sp. SE-J8]